MLGRGGGGECRRNDSAGIVECQDGFGDGGQAPECLGGALEAVDIELRGDAENGNAFKPILKNEFGPGGGIVEALFVGFLGPGFGGKIGHDQTAAGCANRLLGVKAEGDGGGLVGGSTHG